MPDSTRSPQRRTANRLVHGEEIFRLLVEAVQDYAIFLLDADGYVMSWNRGAQRIKGYTADEIIGQHFSVFYIPEERATNRPMRLLGWARDHGRFEDEGWRVRKDGTRFWADVVVTALRDAEGRAYAFAKVTRDLTERRAAEEQARTLLAEQQARAAAEEALRARDRFLSIASHELKTPVASLQLATESLIRAQEHGRLDEARLTTGLARMAKSTGRLGVLVSELLDISRLNAERVEPVLAPVDVTALVREVIAAFADLPGGDRVRLAPAEAIWVEGDAGRLEQVFSNLIDNALKYSVPPAPVDVELLADDDEVCVGISDEGIGLDEEAVRHIFEAFGRGRNAEHIQGMGLGLYIAQQIVERHGGRIEIAPGANDTGSRFCVWLPRRGRATAAEPGDTATAAAEGREAAS